MRRIFHSSLFTAVSWTLAIALFMVSTPRAGAAAQRERKFEFEYKATVKDIPAGAKQVKVWIPVPHDSPFQKVTEMQIESPHPYKIQTAQYGNRILHISLNSPERSSFTVAIRFNAVRKEHIQESLKQ